MIRVRASSSERKHVPSSCRTHSVSVARHD
jgi:hypothetical protein